MNALTRLATTAAFFSIVSGCASIPDEQRTASDPWEPMNRSLYAFNTTVDKATLRPVARGYRAILPAPARQGVSNFFSNLTTPRSIVNNLLQGKPRQGLTETLRFVVNSTVGIGGLIDVATAGGLEEHNEDFGQTFAVWGIPDGPYVMLPFLGPKTLRGAIATPLDMLADPVSHVDESSLRDKLVVMRIIDLRYRLLSVEGLLEESRDPYTTVRDSYLQNREFEIFDGEPPEDEDDFFDEFLDDE